MGYGRAMMSRMSWPALSVVRSAGGSMESLLAWPARAQAVMDRVKAALDRIEDVVGAADAAAAAAGQTTAAAAAVVVDASETASRANGVTSRIENLLETWETPLQQLAPVARELTAVLSPERSQSLGRLLDQLPDIIDLIAPAVRGLSTLTPHFDDLMERLNAVGEIVEGVPGATILRRRGQAIEEGE
jgi:ABC-type transporter Mla subunit MlaD